MKRSLLFAIRFATVALILVAVPPVIGAANHFQSSFSGLVKKTGPGVVNIVATKLVQASDQEQSPFGPDDPFKDFFDHYFGNRMPREYRQGALGTGFIIDRDGLILTNNHVVEDTTELKVKLADEREFKADIVGRDPKTDVALIRIKSDKPLPFLPLGDSDALEVGDWVVAIGNPFGLGNTVTSGIVSAKYRQIGAGAYDNFIQTDASINPGNSGGPLLNINGEVIGINSAIFSQSGGSVGIGFAIPINMVRDLLPQLRQGKVRRAYLGVIIQDITPALKTKLGLDSEYGALVSDVVPDGPAARAGIQRGDVILSLNGKPVKNSRELPLMVAAKPIGKSVMLEVVRQGKRLSVKVVTLEMSEEKPSDAEARIDIGPELGLALQALTPEIARGYGLWCSRGLLIVQVAPGSPAEEAGLQPGDIIVEAERSPVADVASLKQIFDRHGADDTILLLVDRDGTTVFITMVLP
ncbi:DegQ family serine endoprotease [uncultured Desulfosarcina sp.]|uniref:DegQ family serine endoprotease n=1 Tax=uncultured Desulfosarcina sp. TaxID=218289 RepID=UPI0029C61DB4|nr:DegQ family serine endoprotease [uncultured Desulfosarcina sp.]